jgi:hypothetical protein
LNVQKYFRFSRHYLIGSLWAKLITIGPGKLFGWLTVKLVIKQVELKPILREKSFLKANRCLNFVLKVVVRSCFIESNPFLHT